MDKKFYESKVAQVRAFFVDSKRFSIEKVDMAPGLDCGDRAYFNFEAKPEFNNVGYHWAVRLEKSSGRMSIVDGI